MEKDIIKAEEKIKKKSPTKLDVQKHKEDAMLQFGEFMDSLINNNEITLKKANILSYWLEDYTKYLSSENMFNPALYPKYERGDIIKVNLGFNVGSEEGGLHYAIVLDKKNAIKSPTITIVPLSSIKNNKKLHSNDVFLGTQVYDSLKNKADNYLHTLMKPFGSKQDIENIPENEISQMIIKAKEVDKIVHELSKMKKGSYAMINQITTISKQRIYDPKTTRDILFGVKISDDNLNLINEKIKKLYIW